MTLFEQLPILVVVVPLFMAPLLAMVASQGRTPWLIATITSAVRWSAGSRAMAPRNSFRARFCS